MVENQICKLIMMTVKDVKNVHFYKSVQKNERPVIIYPSILTISTVKFTNMAYTVFFLQYIIMYNVIMCRQLAPMKSYEWDHSCLYIVWSWVIRFKWVFSPWKHLASNWLMGCCRLVPVEMMGLKGQRGYTMGVLTWGFSFQLATLALHELGPQPHEGYRGMK